MPILKIQLREQYRARGIPLRCLALRLEISRSGLYYQGGREALDGELSEEIRRLAFAHPAWGYRSIGRFLGRQGMRVNLKRVYRLYCGLRLQKPARRRKRDRVNRDLCFHPTDAQTSNQVWAMDFVHDWTRRDGAFRILTVEDTHDRYAFPLLVAKHIGAEVVRNHLEALLTYGRPQVIRRDNGAEFRSGAVQNWMARKRIQDEPIPKGKPFLNGFIESFHATLRRECLDVEEFETLAEAQYRIEKWRNSYNEQRPHSSLEGQTPAGKRRLALGKRPFPQGQYHSFIDNAGRIH